MLNSLRKSKVRTNVRSHHKITKAHRKLSLPLGAGSSLSPVVINEKKKEIHLHWKKVYALFVFLLSLRLLPYKVCIDKPEVITVTKLYKIIHSGCYFPGGTKCTYIHS